MPPRPIPRFDHEGVLGADTTTDVHPPTIDQTAEGPRARCRPRGHDDDGRRLRFPGGRPCSTPTHRSPSPCGPARATRPRSSCSASSRSSRRSTRTSRSTCPPVPRRPRSSSRNSRRRSPATTPPDISYTFGSWASQLERSGRTLDLRDVVSDPEVRWDEFSSAARETAQPTGGKVIGFPAVVDNISLLYNTTVFDRAGVAYPTADWTWTDFRRAAKRLTDADSHTYGYGYSVSGSEETTWQLWPHLWQNGGAILSEDGEQSAFDSKAGVEAVTFLRAMAVDDRSVYLDQTDTKAAQLFASDRIGMITSGPWQLSALQTAKTSYGVVQLPGTDGDHQTVSGPDLWTVFDNEDVNRAHWATEFTRWLTSAEQDERFNVAVGNLPLRSSETSSAAFRKQVAALPGLDVMQANSANAEQARPTVPGYNGLSEAVGNGVARVLQGEGTPAETLRQATVAADKALRQG
ncbi:extracellular solute-binding protein [Curtobacterium sp. MCPF17_052]|uniref:extracellular solute-binding protein n=1 Tax=Curtobacterium sp. MCPF17_052 TaxID=2175655 RepID=UPI0024DFC18C|nr:extracellular solute-binding protein [Curtobacterium sp. MCPF17_052]WIB12622.1 extracellular solute-binding protein [Curtobacterium sp. MCPF17_052]